jgi:transcriptional regulator with XRE-family HTH domain
MVDIKNVQFDGSRLKDLRNDLTLREVAENIGTSRQNLHAFEVQRAKPSADMLVRLCKFFKVPVSYFEISSSDCKLTVDK